MSRKKTEDFIIKYIDKIYPGGATTKAYKEKFSKMSDKQFKTFMEELRDGKRELVMIAPPGDKQRLSLERNIKIGKELGHDFYQRLWMTSSDGIRYLTPVKYLILELPYRRTAQLLVKKISVPKTSKVVDNFTGQVTGSSKGSAVTYPELLIMSGLGLDKSVEELIKHRGGDRGSNNAFIKMANEYGTVKQSAIEPFSSEVSSKTTAKHFFIAAMLRNNL